MPSDFPFIRLLWQKLPIVYNNRFSLEINDDGLKLIPNSKYGLLNRGKNINLKVDQTIFIQEFISLSRFKNPDHFMKIFTINWIQVNYLNEQKEEAEILLCAGGKFMPNIVKKTDNIFNSIHEKFIPSPQ